MITDASGKRLHFNREHGGKITCRNRNDSGAIFLIELPAVGNGVENLKAQQELEIFDQLSKKQAEEVERERRQIQQFVYKLRDQTPGAQPQ